MKIFETNRLIIRRFEPRDAAIFFQLNANPRVLKFTGDLPFESIESASNFIANYKHYELHGFGRWSAELKSTGECIGWCGLKNVSNQINVGFRFFEEHWNQGYATESAKGSIAHGFDQFGLTQIVGRCSVDHAASAKVLQKVGMEWWKKDLDEDIGLINVYRILKS